MSFFFALALVAAVTILNLLALPEVGYHTVSILYLLSVIAIAFFASPGGRAVRCAALSAVAVGLLFHSPALHVRDRRSSRTRS